MTPFRLARSVARGLVLLGGTVAVVAALAATPMGHIRGTIVSASADQVTVRTAEGDVKVAVDPQTRVAGVVAATVDQIRAGTFVGIANVPGADASRALEVVVFPEAMKGTGLGDYPWDLEAGSGGSASAMTNGTVTSAAAASTMTNGTVVGTGSGNGLVLDVDYGKGAKKIRVPAGVPVVGIVPGDASKLVPGAHVFVATRKDAPQSAGFIAVGIDGAVPPM